MNAFSAFLNQFSFFSELVLALAQDLEVYLIKWTLSKILLFDWSWCGLLDYKPTIFVGFFKNKIIFIAKTLLSKINLSNCSYHSMQI